MDYFKTDWTVVENIASQICEEEYELLTRDEIDDIEKKISEGKTIETSECSGMAFDFQTALNLVSIAITAISIVQSFWVNMKRKPSSSDEIMEWIRNGEVKLEVKPEVKEFIDERIKQINEKIEQ